MISGWALRSPWDLQSFKKNRCRDNVMWDVQRSLPGKSPMFGLPILLCSQPDQKMLDVRHVARQVTALNDFSLLFPYCLWPCLWKKMLGELLRMVIAKSSWFGDVETTTQNLQSVDLIDPPFWSRCDAISSGWTCKFAQQKEGFFLSVHRGIKTNYHCWVESFKATPDSSWCAPTKKLCWKRKYWNWCGCRTRPTFLGMPTERHANMRRMRIFK